MIWAASVFCYTSLKGAWLSGVVIFWHLLKIDMLLKCLKLGIQKWRHQELLATFEICFLKSLNENHWGMGS